VQHADPECREADARAHAFICLRRAGAITSGDEISAAEDLLQHRVRLAQSKLSPEALGCATAELHGSRLMAFVKCRNSNQGAHVGRHLRMMDRCAPTYSERATMPYRNIFHHKVHANERETYIGAFMEGSLLGVLQENLATDVTAHGSLLQCARLNSTFPGRVGFDPTALADGVVLYANALSLALRMSNVTSGSLFAAVRVMRHRGSAKLVVNPSASDLRHATSQLLYIGTRAGPLSVVYDLSPLPDAHTQQDSQSKQPVYEMLDAAHTSALESIAEQEMIVAKSKCACQEWPTLTPSLGALRVMQEMAAPAVDAFLHGQRYGRAQQCLIASSLEVRFCWLPAHALSALHGVQDIPAAHFESAHQQ
jgi:hypothetical protein